MPLSLATIRQPTATAEMPYLDEVLTIKWRPGGLTPEAQDVIASVAEKPATQQTKAVIKVLSDIVSSWDLLDDRGKAIPVTAPNLAKLPLEFLWAVLNFLDSEASPKGESAPPSSGT
jgi:hypothetical protein